MSDSTCSLSGWEKVRLEQLGTLFCGQSPSSAMVNSDGNGTTYITGPEQWDGKDIITNKWTTDPKRVIPENCILITVKGSVGEMFRGGNCAIGRDIYAFKPSEILNYEFVYLAIEEGVNEIVLFAKGDIPGISKHHILDHHIYLPNRKTQDLLVAKIEELFSELDKGIESLTTAKAQLQVYRQSLLKHAFEGKLTEQWRKDHQDELESTDELLARIQDEREARYQQQVTEWQELVKQWEEDGKEGQRPKKPVIFKSPESLSEEELSVLTSLPLESKWVKVGEVFDVFVGATPSRKNDGFWNGDIPWISSGEVAFRDIVETSEAISLDGYNSASTSIHPVGTVILAMIGEGKTRGQAAITRIEACHNQNTAAIRVSETDCSEEFFFFYLMFCYQKTRLIGSGNNQKALNKDKVSNMPYPLYPIEEQVCIANILDDKLSAIERVVQEIEINLQKSEALRQSILKKAFSGQLVPQDPNDEPASELLKRIAVEKAELEAQAKQAKAASRKPRKKTTAA